MTAAPYFKLIKPRISSELEAIQRVMHPLRRANMGEEVIFGYQLPYLPDFLSDTQTIGESEVEKMAFALQRWMTLVANLWKWQHCSFSLRLLSDPSHGAIQIGLVTRVNAAPGYALNSGVAVADDLADQLASLHIPIVPCHDDTVLQRWLSPFVRPAIVELRQMEEVAGLQLGNAYVVYPYWQATGDWLALCDTLVRQRVPVLLSMHLEPTQLTSSERSTFDRAASLGQELEDFSYQGRYNPYRIRDPLAGIVGRIYATNSKRLREPFLLTVQIASPDQVAVGVIARLMSTSIITRPQTPATVDDHNLPSECQMTFPQTEQEYQAALHTLTNLRLTDWGTSEAGEDQERLRYLADARGAVAAFRLPIALRSGIPGIVTRQVTPAYSLGPRTIAITSDDILLGTLPDGGLVTIHKNDMIRHTLIAGFTRSGKTNSCLNLLDQLWRKQQIPFLTIEPVKTEYRGLIAQPGFEQLLIFTLGDESVAPFRLNPFELLPGVRLEAHIGALRACFDAALPQFGVLPILIEESIYKVYEDLGWQLNDKGSEPPPRRYPTLRDLYQALDTVVAAYSGELKQNLQAAISKRVGSLLKGSKGRMFDTQRGISIDILMQRPVILELDQLSEDEQALAMMFILMFVREYRRLNRSHDLRHVTLVEEAHLIMANAHPVSNPEVAADTQAEGSQAFERMLAEIGGLGEGMIVAEQSPSKLVAGAINNTSLKIAHQMVGPREVAVMGDAMIMDEQQKLQVQRLRVGHAGVFMSGFEKATFMAAPSYKRDHQFDDQLIDKDVVDHMQPFYADHREVFVTTQSVAPLPFGGCQFCTSRCYYRAMVEPITKNKVLHRQFYDAWVKFSAVQPTSEQSQNAWRAFVAVTVGAGSQAGAPRQLDAAWCYWVQQAGSNFVFKPQQRDEFEITYRDIIAGNT